MSRATFFARSGVGAAICGLVLLPGGAALAGGGRLDARYDVSLAGLEIGKAALVVEVGDNHYTTAASAKISGVVQVISDGRDSAGARGTIAKDRLQPSSFALTAINDRKQFEIRFSFDKQAIKEVVVEPPPKPRADRVPVTEEHRKGVLDPMSAVLFLYPGSGELIAPEACNRTLPIFEGTARFDVDFEFVRIEKVKAKHFAGDAVVCRAIYKPIAGHRKGRKEVEYMEKNKEMFAWLVPVAGSRALVPFRISVATKIGTVLVEATSFSTQAVDMAPAAINVAPSR